MIYRPILILSLAAAFSAAGLAQNDPALAGTASAGPADPGTVPATEKAAPPADTKKNWHVEVGGYRSSLTNNYGTWKGTEARIMYGGLKRITPFGSVSSQSVPSGSQRVYGGGAYIHINKWAYLIAGASGAPVRNPNVIVYPKFRWDVMAAFNVPKVQGLVLTTGFTDFRSTGGGASMMSVGSMYYYKKAIFSGSISFNRARPGNVPSKSGQAGVMYGTQGKYWIGAGVSGGRVAYQLAGAIPFDARFASYGTFLFYQRWLGKNWGMISRYDFQNLVNAYQRNGVSVSLFADF